jgi:anti-sigma-K factor RskA
MNIEGDRLDRRLSALKAELADLRPPPAVDRAIAAAVVRAERASAAASRWSNWRAFLAWPASVAIAAALAVVVWTLRASFEREAQPAPMVGSAATDFIPVVPVADIARTHGVYVVSTPLPRTMLADLGLPVSPLRAAEPVQSELLVRADGTVLAVRFLE